MNTFLENSLMLQPLDLSYLFFQILSGWYFSQLPEPRASGDAVFASKDKYTD